MGNEVSRAEVWPQRTETKAPPLLEFPAPASLPSVIWSRAGARFVWEFFRRDLRVRYAQGLTGLGPMFLLPFVNVLIYLVVFSGILHVRTGMGLGSGFFLYLCAGLIPWNAYSEGIIRSLNVYAEFAPVMRKIQVPPGVLVGYVSLTVCVSCATYIVMLTLCSIVLHGAQGLYCLVGLCLLPLLLMAMIPVGMVTALAAGFIKDLRHISGVVLHVLFWATPIVYPMTQMPAILLRLEWLNPVYGLVACFQDTLYRGTLPTAEHFLMLCAWSLPLLLLGMVLYRVHAPVLADHL